MPPGATAGAAAASITAFMSSGVDAPAMGHGKPAFRYYSSQHSGQKVPHMVGQAPKECSAGSSVAALTAATSLQQSMRCMNLADDQPQPRSDQGPQQQGTAPMAVDQHQRHPPHHHAHHHHHSSSQSQQLRLGRPKPLELSGLSSQPSQELQYTPDYLTPQDLQFAMEYDPATTLLEDDCSRSPAPSPHRMVKRPRAHGSNLNPHNGVGEDDERSSQSHSQSRTAGGEPSSCSKALSGRPPLPPQRVQPPMPRNPYLTRSEDNHHVFQASQACTPRAGYSRFLWDYLVEAELGHGNFSKVYRAVHRLTGTAFAIKTNKQPIHTLALRNQWLNEMQALSAAQGHPGVVALHDVWFEADKSTDAGCEAVYFKLELCGESLRDMFWRKHAFKEPQLLDIMRQVASALRHVHALGMVHLDVKPDNIYCALSPSAAPAGPSSGPAPASVSTPRGGVSAAAGGGGLVFKLGDFGLAMHKGTQRVGTSEGDSKYLGPEALKSRDYLTSGSTDKLDMFALGASMYELMTGRELPKNGPMWQDLRAGKLMMMPHISMKLQGLLKKLMSPDPTQRPSADALLRTIAAVTPAGSVPASPGMA